MCFQGCSWGRSTMTSHRAPRCLLRCPPCPACLSWCQQPPTRKRAAKTAAPRQTKALSSSGPPPPPSPAVGGWVPPRHTARPRGPRGHERPARNWVSSARSPHPCEMPAPQGLSVDPQRHPSVDGGGDAFTVPPGKL